MAPLLLDELRAQRLQFVEEVLVAPLPLLRRGRRVGAGGADPLPERFDRLRPGAHLQPRQAGVLAVGLDQLAHVAQQVDPNPRWRRPPGVSL